MFNQLRKRILDWLKLERAVEPWVGGETNNTALPVDEAYTIELLDDNATTYVFVVSALVNCFGINANTALDLATTLDKTGSITIGRMTNSVAVALRNHLESEARDQDFPLRISVRELRDSRNPL